MWRFLKWSSALVVALVIVGAVYFWYTFMSPYGYHPPQATLIDERVERQDVFVYGTLRNDLLRWVIMGSPEATRSATLLGYRRQDLDIHAAADAKVEGEVLTVSPQSLEALDRYERLGVRYERKAVKLEDGSPAWVYQRLSASASPTP